MSTSVQVPTVALSSIGSSPPRKTSAIPSRSRSISRRNPARRSIAYAHTGPRVFPARIAMSAGSIPASPSMTRYAPSVIPGQTHGPIHSRQARAMPVGSHRGVTAAPSMTTRWVRPTQPDT
ncbi:hypothetical protein GCM10020254_11480 [Streptomyces goshikiensis]